jgi:hypothetical protein
MKNDFASRSCRKPLINGGGGGLAPERVERFYELAQMEALSEEEGLELAGILQTPYRASDEVDADEEGGT